MPIYEFLCQNCGKDFERMQSFSDQSLPICPACQSTTVHRKLSSPAIHFKGSGWYITDSKSSAKSASSTETGDKKAGDAGNQSTTEASSSEKSETTPKTDTKTEAAKESSSAPKVSAG